MFNIAKEKPPFSVGYMKLTNPDGTIVADKSHQITCYKPGKSLDEPIPNFKGSKSKGIVFAHNFDRCCCSKAHEKRRSDQSAHRVGFYSMHTKLYVLLPYLLIADNF